MKKIAVFFPGIGYTVDKPLLYYSRRLVSAYGYEVRLLPYSGFPDKVKGDKERMRRSFEIARSQSRSMMADLDLGAYGEILFLWARRRDRFYRVSRSLGGEGEQSDPSPMPGTRHPLLYLSRCGSFSGNRRYPDRSGAYGADHGKDKGIYRKGRVLIGYPLGRQGK